MQTGLTEKQKFWLLHLEAHRESGLTRKAYCEKHALSVDQMSYFASYLKKKKKVKSAKKSASGPAFIKLSSSSKQPTITHLTIRLVSGAVIECPAGDDNLLCRIVRAVQ